VQKRRRRRSLICGSISNEVLDNTGKVIIKKKGKGW
jgi:hypothetical protein